ETIAAVEALSNLGPAATPALPELEELLPYGPRIPSLPLTLGNCGPAAGGALPGLRAMWDEEITGGERLHLAIAIVRIDPSDSVAMEFLRSAARGALAGAPHRIKAGHVPRALAEVRGHGEVLVPLLTEILEREELRSGSIFSDAVRALSRLDPARLSMEFHEMARARYATNAPLGAHAAAMLYRWQPTNQQARAMLLDAAHRGGAAAWIAAQALTRGEPFTAEDEAAVRRLLADSKLPREVRSVLKTNLRAVERRERTRRDAGGQ